MVRIEPGQSGNTPVASNAAIARRIIEEVIDTGDLALADQLVAVDYREGSAFPGLSPGREGLKQWIRMARAAFPDWRHTIEDIIAEEDRVVVRTIARGTHWGEFMGLLPTGKQVTQPGIDIMRIGAGQMVEHWGQYDWLGLLQQLGALPAVVPARSPERA